MKLGVLLPTFQPDAGEALRVAAAVAANGLDGVFCYDHLWPMGTPTRPALAPFPLLALIATNEPTLALGPLVARVGLGGNELLVERFATLRALAPGRVIAALGTGDRLSRAENEAYGLAFDAPEVRRGALAALATELRGDEEEVWIGAGAAATNELARTLNVTLNLWNASLDTVRDEATRARVTWAGDLTGDVAAQLDELEAAGAAWVVGSTNVRRSALYEWRRRRGVSSVT
ncbi:MAG TPA: LLM class flavin-dependent oxidoreductase [Acidimicrobiales bacterium]|nr:LLM class flavin-dependent oxidoreductase [Acidimicrobiales bacterium]